MARTSENEEVKNVETELPRPTCQQIERELRRRELAAEARRSILKAANILLVFAAAAVLTATLLFPTVQVQRGSMAPTLRDGEQLILIAVGRVGRGDIIVFRLGNQTLIKRVIATAGETVDIDAQGAVHINGERLNEPYLQGINLGECDIEFPFQVPDNQFFVMGDNRAASLDSRLGDFGTIHRDEIIGKAILRIWPLTRIGLLQ